MRKILDIFTHGIAYIADLSSDLNYAKVVYGNGDELTILKGYGLYATLYSKELEETKTEVIVNEEELASYNREDIEYIILDKR